VFNVVAYFFPWRCCSIDVNDDDNIMINEDASLKIGCRAI